MSKDPAMIGQHLLRKLTAGVLTATLLAGPAVNSALAQMQTSPQQQLLDGLKSTNDVVLFDTIQKYGSSGRNLLPALISAVNDKTQPKLQANAIRTLGILNIQDPTVTNALVRVLHGDNAYNTVEALRSLAALGPYASNAASDIFDFVRKNGENSDITYIILQTLQQIRPSTDLLLSKINDPDLNVRYVAIKSLGFSKDKRALSTLLTLLKDPDPQTHLMAAQAIKGWGPVAEGAIPDLRARILSDEDIDIGYSAWAEALGAIGKKSVPVLIEVLQKKFSMEGVGIILNKKFEDRRSAAVAALRDMGPDAKDAAPALIDTLMDRKVFSYFPAKDALIAVGKPSVPLLTPLLSDPNPDIRRDALSIMERIGTVPDEVIPVILNLLKNDPNELVKSYAVEALAFAGNKKEEVRKALIQTMNASDLLRHSALKALGKLGVDDSIFLPILSKALDSSDTYDRTIALDQIIRLGPRAKILESKLKQIYEHGAPKGLAAIALVNVGNYEKSYSDSLVLSLESDSDWVPNEPEYAAAALNKLGPISHDVTSKLLGKVYIYDGYNLNLGYKALKALEILGPAAKDVLPTLRLINANPDYKEFYGEQVEKTVNAIEGHPSRAMITRNVLRKLASGVVVTSLLAVSSANRNKVFAQGFPSTNVPASQIQTNTAVDLSTDEKRINYLADLIDKEHPDGRKPGIGFLGNDPKDIFNMDFGRLALKGKWISTLDGNIFIPGEELYKSQDNISKFDSVQLLMNYPNPEGESYLIKLTQHPNGLVRVAAATALGYSKRTQEVTDALIKLLDDPNEDVKLAAILSLGPKTVNYRSNNPYWELNDFVLTFKPDLSIYPKLEKFLSSRNVNERIAAAAALGDICDQRAIKSLILLLNDENEHVKHFSSSSLALLRATGYLMHHQEVLNELPLIDLPKLKEFIQNEDKNKDDEAKELLIKIERIENERKSTPAATNGGIDLNQIDVLRKGKTVNVHFDPAQLNELMQGGFKGFTPVIINMTPISSPFQLLGINVPKQEVRLVKA